LGLPARRRIPPDYKFAIGRNFINSASGWIYVCWRVRVYQIYFLPKLFFLKNRFLLELEKSFSTKIETFFTTSNRWPYSAMKGAGLNFLIFFCSILFSFFFSIFFIILFASNLYIFHLFNLSKEPNMKHKLELTPFIQDQNLTKLFVFLNRVWNFKI